MTGLSWLCGLAVILLVGVGASSLISPNSFAFAVRANNINSSVQAGSHSARLTAAAISPTDHFGTLPPGSALPSDSDCALRVRRSSWEPNPDNAAANRTPGITGVRIDGASPYFNALYAGRINGRFTGTTDEILQWGACKWGLDEDIQRARAVQESSWRQSTRGDLTASPAACAAIGQPAPCYESYGLLQVRGSVHKGTYPTARDSTAFNVDYSLAWQRACYEGDFTWLGKEYAAGDTWGCVGAWFSGRWYDDGAQEYISLVKTHLANQAWRTRANPARSAAISSPGETAAAQEGCNRSEGLPNGDPPSRRLAAREVTFSRCAPISEIRQ